eukprot:gene4140-biopygen12430
MSRGGCSRPESSWKPSGAGSAYQENKREGTSQGGKGAVR